MTEWTPTCEALPPANELCVGVYDGTGDEHPMVRLVCLVGDTGEWVLIDNNAQIDAYPPRLWALVPAFPYEWANPCPVGGEIVDYEANVCSCGRVGGVTP